MTTNGTSTTTSPSSKAHLTFYTNHGCPWAHRAHITLHELSIPYKETIIDLDTPRSQSYLAINPRGTVPSLTFTSPDLPPSTGPASSTILTESSTIAQFLADAFPKESFFPQATKDLKSSVKRAQILWFADTYKTYITPHLMTILKLNTLEEKQVASEKLVADIQKHIEPHLKNAGPFFDGSTEFTLAEALVAPFVVRLWTQCDDTLLPRSLNEELMKLDGFGKWAEAISKRESVLSAFDVEMIRKKTIARMDKLRATH